MTVTLKTLIEVAPFESQTKSQLLAKLDTLNEDQKYRLTSTCWTALSAQFQARYKARIAQAFLDMREGTKNYTKEELHQIETDLYNEFARLLKSAETEEEVAQVREELKKYTSPAPTTATISASAPPVPNNPSPIASQATPKPTTS